MLSNVVLSNTPGEQIKPGKYYRLVIGSENEDGKGVLLIVEVVRALLKVRCKQLDLQTGNVSYKMLSMSNVGLELSLDEREPLRLQANAAAMKTLDEFFDYPSR